MHQPLHGNDSEADQGCDGKPCMGLANALQNTSKKLTYCMCADCLGVNGLLLLGAWPKPLGPSLAPNGVWGPGPEVLVLCWDQDPTRHRPAMWWMDFTSGPGARWCVGPRALLVLCRDPRPNAPPSGASWDPGPGCVGTQQSWCCAGTQDPAHCAGKGKNLPRCAGKANFLPGMCWE